MEYKQSLISKYLPRQFNQYELEPSIVNLLQNAIKYDCLNILLISNSGCGKTSLLHTIVNSYFKSHPRSLSNILTISSTKEQGISYYRGDVRTFCQSVPTVPNKKRIVILDDLDLISEQSQQVFRNCIDKYSNHVHFMASCTNSQKVIESLQSRLLSVKIPPLSKQSLSNIMNKIIEKEKIIIEPQAANYILDVSDTSARTLINYLEKITLLKRPIDLNTAHLLCTDISYCDFDKYISFCKEGKLTDAIQVLYSIYDSGFSVMDILNSLFLYLKRQTQLENNKLFDIIPNICKHIISFNDIHEHPIELAFFTSKVLKIFHS